MPQKYPDDEVRDGKESFPEQGDLSETTPVPDVDHFNNPDLDEALRETFPANDPIALGHRQK